MLICSDDEYFYAPHDWYIVYHEALDDELERYEVECGARGYIGNMSTIMNANTIILFSNDMGCFLFRITPHNFEIVAHEPDIAQYIFDLDMQAKCKLKNDEFTVSFFTREQPRVCGFCWCDLKALIDSMGLNPHKALDALLAHER